MGTDHTCPLHLAGDRLCYKGCGCRCDDCTEMHHWSYRGPRPAAPELYLQDLSAGNCAGFPQFTELPDAAQYRACITCPVFAICPQPTPWPRLEASRNVCVSPHGAEVGVRIGSRMGKPRNEASPAGNRALTTDLIGVEMAALSVPSRRPSVHRSAGRWAVNCPCGFTWRTRHHRLAVLIAVEHAHRVEVVA